jgi:hypothetical protein
VGVLVGLTVFVAVRAVPLTIIITPLALVFVFVGVRVNVFVGVADSLGMTKTVGVFVRVFVWVDVKLGAAVAVGGGDFVQVGGNCGGASVEVGNANVGGTLIGRSAAGKTWFGRRKITPKMTTVNTTPASNITVSMFQTDGFIFSSFLNENALLVQD